MVYAVMYDQGNEFEYFVCDILDSVWSSEEKAMERQIILEARFPEDDRNNDVCNIRIELLELDTEGGRLDP